MSKRRKVWWIVGGVATAFALFVVTAFLIDYNSTEARMERAVAQIVEEYGFEYRSQDPRTFAFSIERKYILRRRESVDVETSDEIVAILRDACPSWEYKVQAYDFLFQPVTETSDYVWQVSHRFTREDEKVDKIASIEFTTVNTTYMITDFKTAASLSLYKNRTFGLWQRIKGMGPW